MPEKGDIVTIENARVIWPNFKGAPDPNGMNAEGDRNFNLHLTADEADKLAADGWNVKCKLARPDDEDQEERCVLKITVKYGIKDPRIIMVGDKSRNRTEINQNNVGLLDDADIKQVDLTFVPYFWTMFAGKPNEATGVTAYLRSMYVEVVEDDLDRKWAEPSDA